jgi:hypothetical protein
LEQHAEAIGHDEDLAMTTRANYNDAPPDPDFGTLPTAALLPQQLRLTSGTRDWRW